jgi:bifunctional N-acetylglucosamine-1-phosphate-uridyltransferase/glucosamine-1-phosphate-acetyltransferase GlmU-like protein
MSKKYILTQDTISHSGKILHKIKALKDFGDIKAGELGGYIEAESNLSHDGNCWVYSNAQVYGDAIVSDNAIVAGNAWVSGNAQVTGNAIVSGKAWVLDNAQVSDNAHVYGNAQVTGNAWVSGNAQVTGNAQVSDNAHVYGNAHLKNFDEISKTKHYFNILGFNYPITVTPTSINIGCMSFTFDMLDKEVKHENFSQDEVKRIKTMIELALDQILENI